VSGVKGGADAGVAGDTGDDGGALSIGGRGGGPVGGGGIVKRVGARLARLASSSVSPRVPRGSNEPACQN